ncbi:MAG TPA: T9SS type A sorting domain-containing protein [bacterium]|nr:T9SS type A sorting domain-containing protein [bacterium]
MTLTSIARVSLLALLRSGLIVVLIAVAAHVAPSEGCTPGWETFDDPQTNVAYAVCEYEGVVYRGGWFLLVRWGAGEWEFFGGGIGGDMGTLFAADFTTFESPPMSGDEVLVVGGYFPTAGGMTVNSIATWDGAAFGAMGGGVDGEIRALATYEGDVIAGGNFNNAGGVPVSNIARWDGSAWHALGSGVYDEVPGGSGGGVWDMVVWQGDLYVVGDFTHAGGTEVLYVARWDGSAWSDVGGGVSMIGGGPTGLRGADVHEGDLVIVGALDFAGGVEANNVARWDGATWSRVGSGPDPYDDLFNERQAALAVASYKGLLYVGADFSEAVGDEAEALAVWDGVSWEPVDAGLEGGGWPFGPQVRDLEVAGEWIESSLLIGGDFSEANGLDTDNVARYTTCDDTTGVAAQDGASGCLQLYLSPNPTTGSSHYEIRLEGDSEVSVELFDLTGRRVASLLSQRLTDGIHRFPLVPGETRSVASGVYFLRAEAEGSAVSRKVVLIQ